MEPIEKILLPASRGVLSFTGGGGKTSLMFHLARLIAGSGKRVLTTTTTKIFYPTADQSGTVLVERDPAVILRQAAASLSATRHLTAAAARLDGDKLAGFPPETIRTFEESGLFDWILVEADGSARRPLKAPADHEPVVPLNTTVLVGVAGLEVLGAPLTGELVFRPELAGNLMRLSPGETITEVALAHLFSHPLGLFKGAPPQALCFIFLNKADDSSRIEGAARIAAILRRSPLPDAESLIVGQALESIRVHACHPLKGEP
jgi:probable selenium-dependent hydroxylase accessory protein YqeC